MSDAEREAARALLFSNAGAIRRWFTKNRFAMPPGHVLAVIDANDDAMSAAVGGKGWARAGSVLLGSGPPATFEQQLRVTAADRAKLFDGSGELPQPKRGHVIAVVLLRDSAHALEFRLPARPSR